MAKARLRIIFPLLASALSLAGCQSELDLVPISEVEAKGFQRIDFEWSSHDNVEAFDYFYYSDDFFSKPASTADMTFAHASYAWAIANFPCDKFDKENYANKSRNARTLATSLGFKDFECNHSFTVKPQVDSIGLTLSRKELTIDGNICTVILLGIRGDSYEAEWASNFTLSDEGAAYGFATAANEAINFVSQYVTKHQITGAVKFWVSGYSRAAATTNLFAGFLDEAIRSNSPMFEGLTYGKEDIYAHCFEPPAGASSEVEGLHGEDFNNIKCYINPDDLVPLVAPKEFGFERYGVQNYFPSASRTLKYPAYEAKMLKLLNDFFKHGHKNYKPYAIPSFVPLVGAGEDDVVAFSKDERKVNWKVEYQMTDFISNLADVGIGSRWTYASVVQEGLARTIGMVFEKAEGGTSPFVDTLKAMIGDLLNLDLIRPLIDDIVIEELRPYFGDDLMPFLVRAFKKTLPNIETYEIRSIASGLSELLTAIAHSTAYEPSLTASLISLSNLNAITYTHFPELNYFWVKSMNPLVLKDPNPTTFHLTYQILEGFGAEDIDVINEHGETVMKILDGHPIKLNDAYSYGIRTKFDERGYPQAYYNLYFPSEGSYQVKMRGVAGEAASAVLSYFDPSTSKRVRIKGLSFNYDAEADTKIEISPLEL